MATLDEKIMKRCEAVAGDMMNREEPHMMTHQHVVASKNEEDIRGILDALKDIARLEVTTVQQDARNQLLQEAKDTYELAYHDFEIGQLLTAKVCLVHQNPVHKHPLASEDGQGLAKSMHPAVAAMYAIRSVCEVVRLDIDPNVARAGSGDAWKRGTVADVERTGAQICKAFPVIIACGGDAKHGILKALEQDDRTKDTSPVQVNIPGTSNHVAIWFGGGCVVFCTYHPVFQTDWAYDKDYNPLVNARAMDLFIYLICNGLSTTTGQPYVPIPLSVEAYVRYKYSRPADNLAVLPQVEPPATTATTTAAAAAAAAASTAAAATAAAAAASTAAAAATTAAAAAAAASTATAAAAATTAAAVTAATAASTATAAAAASTAAAAAAVTAATAATATCKVDVDGDDVTDDTDASDLERVLSGVQKLVLKA